MCFLIGSSATMQPGLSSANYYVVFLSNCNVHCLVVNDYMIMMWQCTLSCFCDNFFS